MLEPYSPSALLDLRQGEALERQICVQHLLPSLVDVSSPEVIFKGSRIFDAGGKGSTLRYGGRPAALSCMAYWARTLGTEHSGHTGGRGL